MAKVLNKSFDIKSKIPCIGDQFSRQASLEENPPTKVQKDDENDNWSGNDAWGKVSVPKTHFYLRSGILRSLFDFTSAWDFDVDVKEIGYIGETYNTHQRQLEHRADFNFDPFSAKEQFLHEVTKTGKEMFAIKKTYPSKEMAQNVEAILISALREQLTNSESGNASFDFVSQMNSVRKSEVGELILKDFPVNNLEEGVLYELKY